MADGTATLTACCAPGSRSRRSSCRRCWRFRRRPTRCRARKSAGPSRSSRLHTRPDGALGMNDPGIPDYPNYATALAVSALCRSRGAGWEEQVRPMVAYLRGQQFTEQNGWDRSDPVYGAWGMGGERRTKPVTGHVDLSMTRHVLEALRAAGRSGFRPGFRVRARVRGALPEFRSAALQMMAMAASSSPPPSLTPTKPATTARISAATAPPPPTAFWRCWQSAGRPAIHGSRRLRAG